MAERTAIIEIVPYDPQWKTAFEKLKEMIISYIGDLIIRVEHVGSTSVEGLAAKPVIDLDVVIDNYDVLPAIIKRLEDQGYEYQGNMGIEGREAFQRKFQDEHMKYHLYVCPKDGQGYLEHIALRDYLRENELARNEYQQLKIKLAEQHRFDIDSYCENKTTFITDILKKTLNN